MEEEKEISFVVREGFTSGLGSIGRHRIINRSNFFIKDQCRWIHSSFLSWLLIQLWLSIMELILIRVDSLKLLLLIWSTY